MREKDKVEIIIGFQVLACAAAIVDGHTRFFNGDFDCLAWGAFLLGFVLAGIYLVIKILG